ncbi:FG-GAP-like repeat-containing protein [Winogradskyella sediminis]|uniref:Por secretion system C-terminal sorting domain-containing protein n=1 Tax=Winogradskyella sediminis TaxID=1382466 RepID=A0A1H1VLW8_9FLAO|nr:FG-GAP-like repeat-containing protein [Winogradskyella sediminis]SDS85530.1 Por secretion system C-terminal sorting domain-containing protein [Winogradskyella sediminis]
MPSFYHINAQGMNRFKTVTNLIVTIVLLYTSNIFAQFADPILIESNTGLITNIITADLNNDNLEDIIIIKKFSTNSLISYYLNLGDLNFGPETTIATGNSQVTNIALGDFDHNNWVDIVSIGDASNAVTLHMNNALSFTSEIIDTFSFFESDIAVSDIDNDNDLDIIAIGGSTFKVYSNDGSADFTSQTVTGPIEDFFDITIGDINADGFTDVITGGSNISVYKNNNGNFSYDDELSSQIPNTFNLFVRLKDIDNDGDLDLFSEDNNSTGVRWMKNDGEGNFSNLQLIDPTALNIRSGALQDFDNDNDLDFIIIKDFNLYLYTNDGFGNFSAPTHVQDTETIISTIAAADFNNDGRADIVWSADLSIQENTFPLSHTDYVNPSDFINIYPNPTSKIVFVDSPQEGTLSIFNSKGQVVYNHIVLKQGINELNTELSPETYIFKIDLKPNISLTKKVIIK